MKQQRIHLLLVEDDDLDVMNVHRALSQAPEIASITVARDGIEALKLLRSGGLPLERLVVLLDLRMPRRKENRTGVNEMKESTRKRKGKKENRKHRRKKRQRS